MEEPILGKVTRYLRTKQYGFIEDLRTKETYFVHKKNIVIHADIDCPYPRLYRGEYVQVILEENPSQGGNLKSVSTVTGPLGHTLRCEDIARDRVQRVESGAIEGQEAPVEHVPIEVN